MLNPQHTTLQVIAHPLSNLSRRAYLHDEKAPTVTMTMGADWAMSAI